MVFCNSISEYSVASAKSHNPYFNRWFSAIILNYQILKYNLIGHNPYFNRWFSAIKKIKDNIYDVMSQSLF